MMQKTNQAQKKGLMEGGEIIYIYIYAGGLISGPDFRVSWVNKRPGKS